MTSTMTSKDRVLTAFASQQPDRVPVDYVANAGIDRRLKAHFSLQPDDDEGLRQALGVDIRHAYAPYIGPKLHPDIPERGVRVNEWGVHTVWAEHESGGYWNFCDFPLSEADEETIANWPFPSPDDFDYDVITAACKQYGGYAISGGGPGMPDVINANGRLRGMEAVLMDLVSEEPAGMLLIQRHADAWLEITRRSLEAAKGGIDFLYIGEDLGMQHSPIISLEVFRKHIRPVHQRFVDLAKSFGIPVMIHSCGCSSWAYEDFIEMGIRVVDALQPEATNMAPEYLKKTFGGRLAFHGCISTAGPVAYGTVEDVIHDCREKLEMMMPGGGYCFAPTHMLQDNSPTENVVAMYESVRKYGRYR